MLVRFLSCRERFRLKYVLGLEPPDKWNHRLGYGNMWHMCEEVHAAGGRWDGTDKYYRDICAQYPLQRDEITKWWMVCKTQFPEYVKFWHDHPDVVNRTPLMQEQVFDVPYALPSGRVVRLRGKFDSVDLIECDVCNGNGRVEMLEHCSKCGGAGKGVYLQENKTKGDIDKVQIERQLKFDLQTMLYLVALCRHYDVMGWAATGPLCGVRYNVVRRPLSGGVGNIKPHSAKSTKTKVTPAETDAAFYERLRRDYIAADPTHWFFRVRAEISDADVRVFRNTCLDPLLETVCDWYDYICANDPMSPTRYTTARGLNYRTPFGVYSALEEGGATEYDAFLATGSETGLRRTENLFTELQ